MLRKGHTRAGRRPSARRLAFAALLLAASASAQDPTPPEPGQSPPPQEPKPEPQTPPQDPADKPVETPPQQPPQPPPETPQGSGSSPAQPGTPAGGDPGKVGAPTGPEPAPTAGSGPTGAVGTTTTETGTAEPTVPVVAPPPAFVPAYRGLSGVGLELDRWRAAAAESVHAIDLGTTRDGRPIPAIEFGAAGSVPLEQRPTVFLLGALDGQSLAGGEAVLATVDELLGEPAKMPAGITFVAVPWASPEALELQLAGSLRDGRNARPLDEDLDGRLDEDGPDDLDGDGLVLSMLLEDPRGPWVRCADGRFLAPARAGDAPRYQLVMEGRDDDGDGRFNEDPAGGVVLDLNFPVGRLGPWTGELNGPLPMSEPSTRALADLVLARRTAVVLLFQGNHGGVAMPGGVRGEDLVLPLDRSVYERATSLFARTTGRAGLEPMTLAEAHGEERRGAALDWLYAVPGALALEVAAWGPHIGSAEDAAPRDARFPATAPRSPRPDVGAHDQAWAQWLDDTRGGLGFVDWHPVQLSGGRQALVGGWEPRTQQNPPTESLATALTGIPEFVRELVASLPRLDVIVNQAERSGEVCRISARVRNTGALPTGLAVVDEASTAGPRLDHLGLELVLPAGAKLLAGEATARLPRLVGSELSDEHAWVVLAPPGSTFTLRASSAWTLPAVREVRP